MIKRIILTIVQFFAFLGLLFLGAYWDLVNMFYEQRQMAGGTPISQIHPLMTTIKFPLTSHILIANGLIFASILFVIILAIQAMRRKLKPWAALTTLAFILAVVLGFAMKLGLPPSS